MSRIDPKLTVLVAVGVLALLLGAAFAYGAVRGPEDGPAAGPAGDGSADAAGDGSAAGTTDATGAAKGVRFVSRAGGFAVQVPAGMRVSRAGSTARFTAKDRSLVVSVGPVQGGPLAAARRDFLRTIHNSYRGVEVLGRQRDRIHGRPALSTSGKARNDASTPLRFVVTVVQARPRNYVIAAFAGADADPAVVLPKVNRIAGSFRLLR